LGLPEARSKISRNSNISRPADGAAILLAHLLFDVWGGARRWRRVWWGGEEGCGLGFCRDIVEEKSYGEQEDEEEGSRFSPHLPKSYQS
jgi:hypothetical protein